MSDEMRGDSIERDGFRWTPGAVGLLVAVILIALMWAYILSPFSKSDDVPTSLQDTAYAVAANEASAATQAKIDELPKASTAKTPEERAGTLSQANDMVAELVVKLNALESSDPDDQQFLDQWLADWDSYLASRRAYAEVLASGEDARFAVEAEGGHPITERMDGFAILNKMPKCQVPLDV